MCTTTETNLVVGVTLWERWRMVTPESVRLKTYRKSDVKFIVTEGVPKILGVVQI